MDSLPALRFAYQEASAALCLHLDYSSCLLDPETSPVPLGQPTSSAPQPVCLPLIPSDYPLSPCNVPWPTCQDLCLPLALLSRLSTSQPDSCGSRPAFNLHLSPLDCLSTTWTGASCTWSISNPLVCCTSLSLGTFVSTSFSWSASWPTCLP